MNNSKVVLFYGLSLIGTLLLVVCAAKSTLSQTGSLENQWMGPGMWLAIIFAAVLYIVTIALYVFLEEAKVVHIILQIIGLLLAILFAVILGMEALALKDTILAYATFIAGGIVVVANIIILVLLLKRSKRNYYGSYTMYR
ncbi:MAG TPA: hypothetical protein H9983_07395 [Candidatus Kurthia intestinigallinarum]|uniref:hypothetical protein n=1 Tax=Kurthia sp. Dielmo TaxID=1033738 RepID=UPI0011211E29|nr:hypothetical protein [Kurthia sp. Dielmo]HIX43083.1 hypothetical protein [Candidatus Kurthia intestinigallinarum]